MLGPMTTPRIRLLTVDSPRNRWREFEERLRDDPGFEVVREVNRPIELLLAVGSARIDAVVFFDETDAPGIRSHLFAEYPGLTVLALHPSGAAYIEECCPTRRMIADRSSAGIARALREAVERPCCAPKRQDLN